MIYASEKKAILFTEVSLCCENTDHDGAISPVTLEKLRIMPVRAKSENILLFFLKNEGYIDLAFLKWTCWILQNISFSIPSC